MTSPSFSQRPVTKRQAIDVIKRTIPSSLEHQALVRDIYINEERSC